MEKYIEALIEIVLEHVCCTHELIEEHPRGPKFDDVTYGIDDKQELMKKCIKAIPARLIERPEIDEMYVNKKLTEMINSISFLKNRISSVVYKEIYNKFNNLIRQIISDAQRPEITVEFMEKKTTELHDKLWPEEKCNNLCRRQATIREFLSSLLNELAAKINLLGKEEE